MKGITKVKALWMICLVVAMSLHIGLVFAQPGVVESVEVEDLTSLVNQVTGSEYTEVIEPLFGFGSTASENEGIFNSAVQKVEMKKGENKLQSLTIKFKDGSTFSADAGALKDYYKEGKKLKVSSENEKTVIETSNEGKITIREGKSNIVFVKENRILTFNNKDDTNLVILVKKGDSNIRLYEKLVKSSKLHFDAVAGRIMRVDFADGTTSGGVSGEGISVVNRGGLAYYPQGNKEEIDNILGEAEGIKNVLLFDGANSFGKGSFEFAITKKDGQDLRVIGTSGEVKFDVGNLEDLLEGKKVEISETDVTKFSGEIRYGWGKGKQKFTFENGEVKKARRVGGAKGIDEGKAPTKLKLKTLDDKGKEHVLNVEENEISTGKVKVTTEPSVPGAEKPVPPSGPSTNQGEPQEESPAAAKKAKSDLEKLSGRIKGYNTEKAALTKELGVINQKLRTERDTEEKLRLQARKEQIESRLKELDTLLEAANKQVNEISKNVPPASSSGTSWWLWAGVAVSLILTYYLLFDERTSERDDAVQWTPPAS